MFLVIFAGITSLEEYLPSALFTLVALDQILAHYMKCAALDHDVIANKMSSMSLCISSPGL
jgi:hypothetical protein